MYMYAMVCLHDARFLSSFYPRGECTQHMDIRGGKSDILGSKYCQK